MLRTGLGTILAVGLLWAVPAFAQTPASTQAMLDKRLAEVREETGGIGYGVAVLTGGEVVALSVDGQRWKGGDPLQTGDKWHIGSVTKSMTALLVAILVEEGVMSFEQTLPELLPDMSEEMHPGWQEVRLRHLLNHTSGLPGNFPMRTQSIWPGDPGTLSNERRKWIARALKRAPKSAAGEEFVYSNLAYTVAGYAAAQAADVPFEQLMRKRLFEPAGLSSAGFGAPKGDSPRGHQHFFGLALAKNPDGRGADNTPLIGPAGRAHLSLAEFLEYGAVHLGGSGLVSDETLAGLHTPALRDYASGLVVQEADWAGGRYLWHNGSNTMWYALMIVLPEKDAVLVFTANDGRLAVEPAFFALAEEIALTLPQKAPTMEK